MRHNQISFNMPRPMQIIIPMSGFGERFRRAGYDVPKPMIPVHGKPIICHVIDMFPGETNFLFICNQEHLDTPRFHIRETLERYCPTGAIVGIAPHKLGPVFAVSQAYDYVLKDAHVVVNYCDFTCYWDWGHYRSFMEETGCAGSIPSYRHFHPHLLGSTYYAYLQERDGWVRDIREKNPWTDSPMNEYASSGTYHFSSGRKMIEYFDKTMADDGLKVNGEYYVSMVYRPMVYAGEKVAVYDLQHFMQWGTPHDLAEYRRWADAFSGLIDPRYSSWLPAPQRGTVVIPMAGLGQRFMDRGYQTPKPLIPVSGKPMVVQAACDLPAASRRIFVVRKDLPGLNQILNGAIQKHIPNAEFTVLDKLTDGQARTAMAAVQTLDPGEPVTIGACDNGMLYDAQAFERLMSDPDCDVIVWTMRGHPGAMRNPRQYGWVAEESGIIKCVSVKIPLHDPACDPSIIGTFTFKHAAGYVAAANRMFARDARVNSEFYIDTLINDAIALGLRCRILDVEHYIGWGTPDDLRCFEYWQSCFDKWSGHPYRLELDSRVDTASIPGMRQRYARTIPRYPDRPAAEAASAG